jgi:hypothetical protein
MRIFAPDWEALEAFVEASKVGVPSRAYINVLGRKSSTVEKEWHEDLLLDFDRKFARYWNGV